MSSKEEIIYIVDPKLTDEQKKAVEAKGDVIVSASAGSGKTKTMVERILDLVVNQGVHLKDVLILVYNNAAADELLERLKYNLGKVIKRATLEKEQLERLQDELDDIYLCHISTIHAYCQSLIKENFALAEVSPTFEILTEASEKTYQNKAFALAFDELAEEQKSTPPSPSVFDFNKVFATKRNDGSLQEIVIKIFNALDIQADEDAVEAFKNGILAPYSDFDDNVFWETIVKAEKAFFARAKEVLTPAYSHFEQFYVCDVAYAELLRRSESRNKADKLTDDEKVQLQKAKYFVRLKSFYDFLIDVQTADGFSEIALKAYNFNSVSADAKEWGDKSAEIANQIKDDLRDVLLERIQKLGSFVDASLDFEKQKTAPNRHTKYLKSEFKNSFDQNAAYVKALIEFAEKFKEKFNALKEEDNVLTFGDLEHHAIKLLNNSEFIKPEYKAIFVDEYQDVNPTQEEIIKIVAGGELELFVVGDVKQSIYGFRLANPKNFLNREEDYKKREEECKAEGKETDKHALIFSSNFRSTKEILNFVNLIFDQIMTKEVADVDYKTDGRFDLTKSKEGGQVEVHIFRDDIKEKDDKKKNGGAEEAPQVPQAEAQPAEPNVYDITAFKVEAPKIVTADCEAVFVVQKIQELVDGARAKGRRLCYDDIVILGRYRNDFATIEEYLKQENIPYENLAKKADKGDVPESEIICFLKSIDNPRQDIPFVGYLLSFFGGYSEQELSVIARRSAPSFYDKFLIFAKLTGKDLDDNKELVEKVQATLGVLDKYRIKASFKNVKELIDGIIADFSYDAYLSRSGDAVIYAVRSFVSSISDKDNESLARFLRGYSSGESDDSSSSQTAERFIPNDFVRELVDCVALAYNATCKTDVKGALNGTFERFMKSKIGGNCTMDDVEEIKNAKGDDLIKKAEDFKSKDKDAQKRVNNAAKTAREIIAKSSLDAIELLDVLFNQYKGKFIDEKNHDDKDVNEARSFISGIPASKNTLESFLKWYFDKTGKVRFSTMHSFKGLECEAVFVVGMGGKFSNRDYSGKMALDSNGSMAVNFFDLDNYSMDDNTIAKRATKYMLQARTLKEEMRLMYVALTRAKRYMFVTGCLEGKYATSFGNLRFEDPNSMLGLLSLAVYKDGIAGDLKHFFPQYEKTKTFCTTVSEFFNDPKHKEFIDSSIQASGENKTALFGDGEKGIIEEIEKAQAETAARVDKRSKVFVKYSVTAIDSMSQEEEAVKKVFEEEGANVGTIYHKIMQHIDFFTNDVQAEINRMVDNNVLTSDDIAKLNDEKLDGKVCNGKLKWLDKIESCLASELIAKAREAETRAAEKGSLYRCFREKPFLMYHPASEVIEGEKSNEEIVVQGVIDLLIFLPSEIIIVDFKNSALADKELLAKYEKQLYLYKLAVKDAFGEEIPIKTALYSFITKKVEWLKCEEK